MTWCAIRKNIINDLIEIKKNLKLSTVVALLLLFHFKILTLAYIFWKVFLYIIVIKTIYFSFNGNSKISYEFELEDRIWKTVNYSTSLLAIRAVKSLKFIRLDKKNILLHLIETFVRFLLIVIVGYSLKFVYMVTLLINLQIESAKKLKFKTPLTKIKGFFYYLRKNIIKILEKTYIDKL